MRRVDLETLDFLACPDCRRGLSASSGEECLCTGCGRRFHRKNGIWEMLPLDDNGMAEDVQKQREYYEGAAADSIDKKRRRFSSLHYSKVLGIINEAEALACRMGPLKVCELGVGTAMHASWFLDVIPAERFFGVDISIRSLENGRPRWERYPAFVPVQGSVYRLPMKDRIFDLVYYSGTLHHCLNPMRAVAEAARVLVKGGVLVISEPVWYFPSNLFFNLRIPEEAGQRLLSRRDVEQWCTGAGLTARSFEYFNYLPRPNALEKPAKRLEKVLSRIPLLRRFSSMFRCVALK